MAEALGIRSDARQGGESDGILYLWFPGSGNLRPRTIGEIQNEGEKLLSHLGSEMKRLSSCLEKERDAGILWNDGVELKWDPATRP